MPHRPHVVVIFFKFCIKFPRQNLTHFQDALLHHHRVLVLSLVLSSPLISPINHNNLTSKRLNKEEDTCSHPTSNLNNNFRDTPRRRLSSPADANLAILLSDRWNKCPQFNHLFHKLPSFNNNNNKVCRCSIPYPNITHVLEPVIYQPEQQPQQTQGASYQAPAIPAPSYQAPLAPPPPPPSSGYKTGAVKARSSKTILIDSRCNSNELHQLLSDNIVAGDANESKRKIHKAANEEFSTEGGNDKGIDVICAPGAFSYRIATDFFCEYTKEDITCFAYQQHA